MSLDEEQYDPHELSRAGLRHQLVHMAGESPPLDSTEGACRAALPATYQFLRDEYESTRCVMVHCGGGRDRTALVLAHFLRLCEGITAIEAITRVRKSRPDALAAAGWYEMAVRVLSS